MKIGDKLTEQMLLAYYGELSADEQARFNECLKGDPARARQYHELSALLDTLSQCPAAQLPAEGDEFWTALEHGIIHRLRQHVRYSRQSRWRQLVEQFAVRRVALVFGGIVVAFFAGTIIGAGYRATPAEDGRVQVSLPLPPLPIVTSAPSAASTATNEHLRSFLKRSQLYIATTADKQLACKRCLPIEHQLDHRQFAKELLAEAQRLRRTAHKDPKVKKVLQDIELVLANLSQDPRTLSSEQMEILHNIASAAICEVSSTVGDTDADNPTDRP